MGSFCASVTSSSRSVIRVGAVRVCQNLARSLAAVFARDGKQSCNRRRLCCRHGCGNGRRLTRSRGGRLTWGECWRCSRRCCRLWRGGGRGCSISWNCCCSGGQRRRTGGCRCRGWLWLGRRWQRRLQQQSSSGWLCCWRCRRGWCDSQRCWRRSRRRHLGRKRQGDRGGRKLNGCMAAGVSVTVDGSGGGGGAASCTGSSDSPGCCALGCSRGATAGGGGGGGRGNGVVMPASAEIAASSGDGATWACNGRGLLQLPHMLLMSCSPCSAARI